ncbi:phosphatase-like protein, putative [Bodo saltans]|uniref:Phosphatase-like protein, putative n=1 Tax=Bodo saltans TaxID=75058 RepID=A0A0S4JRF8_BODSA|eukprot:CUG92921.1 phosphatase-like protein, putative [Bodo saltans]
MSEIVVNAKQLFAAANYAQCKSVVEAGIADASTDAASLKDLKLLLRKCNTHMLPVMPVAPEPEPAAPAPVVAAAAPVPPPPLPTVTTPAAPPRFEWFQTPTSATFTFYIKNRTEADVVVNGTDRSLDVTIRLDVDGKEYQYSLERLFAPVQTPPVVSIRSMKVEIVLTKVTPYHWPALEVKDDDIVRTIEQPSAIAAATAPGTSKELAYPNSKGKNWSTFKMDEEEEKPEGDAALNALFKQIYGNGSDEQRKAMIKSFTESNGTVLSTNWDEVGSKKVVGEAPKGMEAKKYAP